ncbi:aldose epimerase family protein [Spongiivirga sp. MCCC 1A20706]|uniref:aldose epimerase family protein n=1 Tax=Spongiivirga sp. MCCC 1A20706 TaxID=3160963 RepID=UPI003977D1A1
MSKVILENAFLKVEILSYGAILEKLFVKNKDDNWQNVVLGLENEEEYKKGNPMYLGACIGPYAGRIDNGRFGLGDTYIQLDTINGVHLHGGNAGFHEREWTIISQEHGKRPAVTLQLKKEHDTKGYPGNITVNLTYQLVENEFRLSYEATTDRTTILNLTNHSYFNLNNGNSITTHTLFINSDTYLETDDRLIPSGNILNVGTTKYDFNSKKPVTSAFLDDTFILNNPTQRAASLSCEESGIRLDVMTNQPAMVVFTPSDGSGICFETQQCPDAPNHSNFPSTVLTPEKHYKQETTFKFSLT